MRGTTWPEAVESVALLATIAFCFWAWLYFRHRR